MIEFIIATILILNPIAAPAAEIFDFNSETSGPQKIENNNLGVELTASNFLIKDIKSNKILFGKDYDQPRPIASITKLMTAMVFIDTEPDWGKEVILEERDETNGAYPHIYRGEKITVSDLFNAMLISSDNNSAKALVRSTEMSEKLFVKKMNNKAKELGLKNTKFYDVIGLSPGSISTSEEVASLLMAALENDIIAKSISQKAYSFSILNSEKSRNVTATNKLIESFLNSEKEGYEIIGGKTGFLPEAGGCLAIVVEKDGHKIISVVLGSSNYETRFHDTKALVDWTFLNYEWR